MFTLSVPLYNDALKYDGVPIKSMFMATLLSSYVLARFIATLVFVFGILGARDVFSIICSQWNLLLLLQGFSRVIARDLHVELMLWHSYGDVGICRNV